MSKTRVVVTGLGIVCPVGNSSEECWNNLITGKSGISTIASERFDTSQLSSTFAGQVRNFSPNAWLENPKDIKKTDLFIPYALAAADQAMRQANATDLATPAHRVGVAIGSGMGGLGFIDNTTALMAAKGPKRVSPFFVPASIINMASGYVSMKWNCRGPNLSMATACTTGTHMIGLAARLIAHGDADCMICGGSEAPITPLGMAGFCAARALSTRNHQPEQASRPWDADRDGFVMGEGAGVLILENREHAQARGATVLAELVGFGMSGDAYHITQPELSGQGAWQAMHNALQDAAISPQAIDYVNAHGTSTPAGDKAEVVAIERLFGKSTQTLAVSSTKSMTGHLLGAAGAIEAIFTVQSIMHQQLPPTINLDNCEFDLDFVPNKVRTTKVDVALSNSFGFGGTNGTLIFAKH